MKPSETCGGLCGLCLEKWHVLLLATKVDRLQPDRSVERVGENTPMDLC